MNATNQTRLICLGILVVTVLAAAAFVTFRSYKEDSKGVCYWNDWKARYNRSMQS